MHFVHDGLHARIQKGLAVGAGGPTPPPLQKLTSYTTVGSIAKKQLDLDLLKPHEN